MGYDDAPNAGEPVRPGEAPGPHGRTWRPVAGGALIVIGGLMGVLAGAATLGLVGTNGVDQGGDAFGVQISPGMLLAAAILGVVINLVAVAGGVMGMQRRAWGFALAGGVLAIIFGGLLIGNVLALIGTILVGISRREFAAHQRYVAERRVTGL